MSSPFNPMTVSDACAVLRAERDDAIAVMTMTAMASWPNPGRRDYRLVGLMGAAGSIGLGLAIGAPDRPVWVLDGDGSLLMQLGVLAAISGAAPRNLTHVVFDNGMYSVSGGQPTPGSVNWQAMFLAAGYAAAVSCVTPLELRSAVRESGPGPRGIAVRCERRRPDYRPGAFALNPASETARFRAAFGGA